MYTYDEIYPRISKGRRGYDNTRKLENNTYARLEGDSIVITLHDNVIATLQPNKITLTSAGWLTQTTKDRLNKIVPGGYHIAQDNKIWKVFNHGWEHVDSVFYDGIEFVRRGNDWEIANPQDDTDQKKISKAALKYVNDFVAAFMAGKLDNPGPGDCWMCCMQTTKGESLGDATKDNSHILSHIEEKYYVPSLLYNALIGDNKKHICSVTEWGLAEIWNDWHKVSTLEPFYKDVLERDVKAVLKAYLYKRLGLAF